MLRITLRGIEISPEATVFAVRASRISSPPSVSFASVSSASEADRAAAAAPSLTTGGRGDGHGILLVGHVDGERRQDARLKADGAGDIGNRQLAERAAAEARSGGAAAGRGHAVDGRVGVKLLLQRSAERRAQELFDGEQAVVRQLIERIGHLIAGDRGVRTADDGGNRDLRVLLDVHGHDDLLHALQHRCDVQGG